MKKVHVNICSSPTCYREAADLFKELNTVLAATIKEQIVLTGIPLSKECNASELMPPCVQINGQMITRATAADVKKAIQKALRPCRMAA